MEKKKQTKKKKQVRSNISLYLKGDIYYARFWDEVEKRYTVTRSTGKRDEKEAYAEAKKMLESGLIKKKSADPFFTDDIMEYWQNKPDIDETYRKNAIGIVNNKIRKSEVLSGLRLSQINHTHFNNFIDEQQSETVGEGDNKKRANSDINIKTTFKIIKMYLRHAHSRGKIEKDFIPHIRTDELKITPKIIKAFTIDEALKLSNINWPDLRMKVAVNLGLWAGMRRGEIRSLQWGDIDFEKNTITIQRNYTQMKDADGNPVFKTPKADSGGTIEALKMPELKKILLQMYEETPFKGADDLVLCNLWRTSKNNQKKLKQYMPMDNTIMKRYFHAMLEKIGIPREKQVERGLVFHSTRHFFATQVASVAHAGTGRTLTRHKSIKVYENYVDYNQEDKSSAMDAVVQSIEKHKQDQAARLAGLNS